MPKRIYLDAFNKAIKKIKKESHPTKPADLKMKPVMLGRSIFNEKIKPAKELKLIEPEIKIRRNLNVSSKAFTDKGKQAYITAFEEELEKVGFGGGLGLGGTSTCVCPKCGHSQAHARGIPCNKTKCAKCGTAMVGSGMPHGLGQGVKK